MPRENDATEREMLGVALGTDVNFAKVIFRPTILLLIELNWKLVS